MLFPVVALSEGVVWRRMHHFPGIRRAVEPRAKMEQGASLQSGLNLENKHILQHGPFAENMGVKSEIKDIKETTPI
jgi:hypothetical protein